jgi:hypothetical protein
VNREIHRRGLEKALQIGRYFVNAADKSETAIWKIHTLKLELDLSLTGEVHLVEITGSISSEITFENSSF